MDGDADKYYKLLGINGNVSLEEIRKAYRSKAKQFHPDVNKAPGAHEYFIAIGEAYAYLVDLHSGKFIRHIDPKTQEERREEERKKNRKRAAEHARMRYAEFLQSDYYKATNTVSAILDLFIAVSAVFLVFYMTGLLFRDAAPLFYMLEVACLFLITVLIWSKSKERMFRYKEATLYLLQWPWFYLVFLSGINLYIFLTIGLATLIPLNVLLLTYLSFGSIAFVALRLRGKKNHLLTYAVAPFLVNLLLLVNYLFSSNPVTERYLFNEDPESTIIHFDHALYEEYIGIRVFKDYTKLRTADEIAYQMEDGLLGFRVMKGYTFFSNRF